MKLFVKLMILVLILAMAGPFFLRGPDGRPLMQVSDITQKFKSWMSSTKAAPSGGEVRVHKWQDENGQWHYSDEAPQTDSETISIDPNTNVIQSTPVRRPVAEESTASTRKPEPEKDDDGPSLFHPINETNKVKEELEERNEQIRQRLDDT